MMTLDAAQGNVQFPNVFVTFKFSPRPTKLPMQARTICQYAHTKGKTTQLGEEVASNRRSCGRFRTSMAARPRDMPTRREKRRRPGRKLRQNRGRVGVFANPRNSIFNGQESPTTFLIIRTFPRDGRMQPFIYPSRRAFSLASVSLSMRSATVRLLAILGVSSSFTSS